MNYQLYDPIVECDCDCNSSKGLDDYLKEGHQRSEILCMEWLSKPFAKSKEYGMEG